jgi:hypothetical protein
MLSSWNPIQVATKGIVSGEKERARGFNEVFIRFKILVEKRRPETSPAMS